MAVAAFEAVGSGAQNNVIWPFCGCSGIAWPVTIAGAAGPPALPTSRDPG
jgi:hypothetical protein